MKLIPASAHALRWLNQTSRVDLTADVERLAASILHLVPSCVGLSLTLLDPDLTLTLAGSNQAIGRLVAAHRIDPDTARSCLYHAAARERRPLPHIARDVADGNTGAA